jgi:hypothetical protein
MRGTEEKNWHALMKLGTFDLYTSLQLENIYGRFLVTSYDKQLSSNITQPTMKVVLAVSLFVAATSSVSAFAPSALCVSRGSQTRTMKIHAEADPKEEEGLDLDLEEMFDM